MRSSSHPETSTVEQDWQLVRQQLPVDLEATARATGALRRRRGVPSAEVLLRLAFAYAYCGLSLRAVAAWAARRDLAHLSDVALLKRLKNAAPWFGFLLTAKLTQRLALPQGVGKPLRVRLVDATSLSSPGATGTDWRVHLGFDLGAGCIDHAELTPETEGETFLRHPTRSDELWIADRGYAHRPGIAAVVGAGGQLLVRLNWHNVPLEHPDGRPFDLLLAGQDLAPGEVAEFAVQTAPHPKAGLPAVAGRLVVLRKSEAAAEAARRQVRLNARRKGRTPDARSLAAADYVFLFTNVAPERLTAVEVLSLYRFRWQIELAFKRLKGLVGLDELTAHDPALCQTFVLVKLLAMLILEDLCREYAALSPFGEGRPAGPVGVAGLPGTGGDPAAGGGGGAHPGRVALPPPRLRPRAPRAAPQAATPECPGALPR
jgi:DDE family transposase